MTLLNQCGRKMAANRQSKVVVGNGKKLATLINKRNKIVKIRVFIKFIVFCNLNCRYLRASIHSNWSDNK